MCESTRCSGSLLADRTQPTVTSWRLEQCTIKGDAAIYMLERGTMASVLDVAEYILKETGSMTTMKLQKLVYYSQAWSLVWDEKPLFGEPIEAWANGPVVRALYEAHRGRFQVDTIENGDPTRPEGGWGWQNVSRATVVERILYKLAHFETMTFPDIERAVKGSHNVSYDQLCRDAQKRLEERGLEDLDQLFSLRLSGKERIWGIREGNVLRILWWDPKHQVCPSLRE